MAKVEQKTNGLWYVIVTNPTFSKPIIMGGYATENDANEMRDFLVNALR